MASEAEVAHWLAVRGQGDRYREWYGRLERAVEHREVALLEQLAEHLVDEHDGNSLRELLALVPDDEAVLAGLTALAARRARPRRHEQGHANGDVRSFAARLAQSRDEDLLYRAIARARDPLAIDLCACWAQELVLRGVALGGPQIDALAERLVETGHPLATLPMHRLPLEVEAPYQPSSYAVTTAGGWSASWPAGDEVTAHADVPAIEDVTVDSDARIASTFDSHRAVSNGMALAKVFALDPPQPRTPDPALLRALPMECFVAEATVAVRAISAPHAFALLLAFASNGGDYNRAWSGAFGRRDAWRSLGGLVGAPLEARLDDIEQRARAARFAHFRSDAWFYQVVTDLGIAAVTADGSQLAVLAGTDSD